MQQNRAHIEIRTTSDCLGNTAGHKYVILKYQCKYIFSNIKLYRLETKNHYDDGYQTDLKELFEYYVM